LKHGISGASAGLGSLNTAASELVKYNFDLMALQEVRWR